VIPGAVLRRESWHASLDSVLEGNATADDLDLTLTSAQCVAASALATSP